MDPELLPCPFCGSPAKLWKKPGTYGVFGVQCSNRGACPVNTLGPTGNTADEAAAKWNTRTDPYAKAKDIAIDAANEVLGTYIATGRVDADEMERLTFALTGGTVADMRRLALSGREP